MDRQSGIISKVENKFRPTTIEEFISFSVGVPPITEKMNISLEEDLVKSIIELRACYLSVAPDFFAIDANLTNKVKDDFSKASILLFENLLALANYFLDQWLKIDRSIENFSLLQKSFEYYRTCLLMVKSWSETKHIKLSANQEIKFTSARAKTLYDFFIHEVVRQSSVKKALIETGFGLFEEILHLAVSEEGNFLFKLNLIENYLQVCLFYGYVENVRSALDKFFQLIADSANRLFRVSIFLQRIITIADREPTFLKVGEYSFLGLKQLQFRACLYDITQQFADEVIRTIELHSLSMNDSSVRITSIAPSFKEVELRNILSKILEKVNQAHQIILELTEKAKCCESQLDIKMMEVYSRSITIINSLIYTDKVINDFKASSNPNLVVVVQEAKKYFTDLTTLSANSLGIVKKVCGFFQSHMHRQSTRYLSNLPVNQDGVDIKNIDLFQRKVRDHDFPYFLSAEFLFSVVDSLWRKSRYENARFILSGIVRLIPTRSLEYAILPRVMSIMLCVTEINFSAEQLSRVTLLDSEFILIFNRAFDALKEAVELLSDLDKMLLSEGQDKQVLFFLQLLVDIIDAKKVLHDRYEMRNKAIEKTLSTDMQFQQEWITLGAASRTLFPTLQLLQNIVEKLEKVKIIVDFSLFNKILNAFEDNFRLLENPGRAKLAVIALAKAKKFIWLMKEKSAFVAGRNFVNLWLVDELRARYLDVSGNFSNFFFQFPESIRDNFFSASALLFQNLLEIAKYSLEKWLRSKNFVEEAKFLSSSVECYQVCHSMVEDWSSQDFKTPQTINFTYQAVSDIYDLFSQYADVLPSAQKSLLETVFDVFADILHRVVREERKFLSKLDLIEKHLWVCLRYNYVENGRNYFGKFSSLVGLSGIKSTAKLTIDDLNQISWFISMTFSVADSKAEFSEGQEHSLAGLNQLKFRSWFCEQALGIIKHAKHAVDLQLLAAKNLSVRIPQANPQTVSQVREAHNIFLQLEKRIKECNSDFDKKRLFSASMRKTYNYVVGILKILFEVNRIIHSTKNFNSPLISSYQEVANLLLKSLDCIEEFCNIHQKYMNCRLVNYHKHFYMSPDSLKQVTEQIPRSGINLFELRTKHLEFPSYRSADLSLAGVNFLWKESRYADARFILSEIIRLVAKENPEYTILLKGKIIFLYLTEVRINAVQLDGVVPMTDKSTFPNDKTKSFLKSTFQGAYGMLEKSCNFLSDLIIFLLIPGQAKKADFFLLLLIDIIVMNTTLLDAHQKINHLIDEKSEFKREWIALRNNSKVMNLQLSLFESYAQRIKAITAFDHFIQIIKSLLDQINLLEESEQSQLLKKLGIICFRLMSKSNKLAEEGHAITTILDERLNFIFRAEILQNIVLDQDRKWETIENVSRAANWQIQLFKSFAQKTEVGVFSADFFEVIRQCSRQLKLLEKSERSQLLKMLGFICVWLINKDCDSLARWQYASCVLTTALALADNELSFGLRTEILQNLKQGWVEANWYAKVANKDLDIAIDGHFGLVIFYLYYNAAHAKSSNEVTANVNQATTLLFWLKSNKANPQLQKYASQISIFERDAKKMQKLHGPKAVTLVT